MTSLMGPIFDVGEQITLSFNTALLAAEEEREKEIALARKYHSGEHGTELTDRLKQFLGEEVEFRMNATRSVVTAVSERLKVIGFDSPDNDLIQWATDVWNNNSLDSLQDDVHENALRDGEYFVLVDWDSERNMPRMIPHERYIDANVDIAGGYGCYMRYVQEDPNQQPLYGIKIWNEVIGTDLVQRRNVYYADKIVKSVRTGLGPWTTFTGVDAGEEGVFDWTNKDSVPFGIPLIHFKNKDLRCEAWDAFPLQNALNKSLLDLLTSADLTAFRIFYALGFIPTTDGKPPAADRSNWMQLEPGQIVGTTKSARETAFGAVSPADLSQLSDLTHQLVLWLAMVTNTPVSRFISTKLIASDATLKEQEGPLISRVSSHQKRFGNSWKEAFRVAMALETAFGTHDFTGLEPPVVLWGEAAVHGESEKLDLLAKKQKLGIPQEQLWKEAGYDQSTIKKLKAMKAKEIRDGQKQTQGNLQGQGDGGNGNGTGPGDGGNPTRGRGNGTPVVGGSDGGASQA